MDGVKIDALLERGDPRGDYLALLSELGPLLTPDALIASSLTGEALHRMAAILRRARQLWNAHDWSSDFELRTERRHNASTVQRRGLELALFLDLEHVDDVPLIAELLDRGFVRDATLIVRPGIAEAARALPLHHLRHAQVRDDSVLLVPQMARLERLSIVGSVLDGLADAPANLCALALDHATREMLDELAAMPIASRLRELRVSHVVDERALAAIFDGRFPALDDVRLDHLEGRTLGQPPRVVPRALDLSGMSIDRRLLQALATPALKALTISPVDGPAIETIATRATSLEALVIRPVPGTAHSALRDPFALTVARTQLRVLELGNTGFEPPQLEALLRRHPLERLRLGGDRSLVIERIAALFPPGRLRELSLCNEPITDAAIAKLAAPAFSALRRLELAYANLSDAALASIVGAGLSELVRLDLQLNVARLPEAACALPALVEVVGDFYGQARAQLRAHFAHPAVVDRLIVFRPTRLPNGELRALITRETAPWDIPPRDERFELPDGSIKVSLMWPREAVGYAEAAAQLSPSIASLIPAIVIEAKGAAHGAALALAQRFGGPIWDIRDDRIY